MKMRTEWLWQKPGRHVEIFVMRLRQIAAIGKRLFKRWRFFRNAIRCRQRSPAAGNQLLLLGSSGHGSILVADLTSDPYGTIAVLISLDRFISFSNTRLSSYKCARPVINALAWNRPLAIRSSDLRQIAGV